MNCDLKQISQSSGAEAAAAALHLWYALHPASSDIHFFVGLARTTPYQSVSDAAARCIAAVQGPETTDADYAVPILLDLIPEAPEERHAPLIRALGSLARSSTALDGIKARLRNILETAVLTEVLLAAVEAAEGILVEGDGLRELIIRARNQPLD